MLVVSCYVLTSVNVDTTGRRVLGPVCWLVVRLAAGFREYSSKRYRNGTKTVWNGVEHYLWCAVVCGGVSVVLPVPLFRPAGRGYFAGLLDTLSVVTASTLVR